MYIKYKRTHPRLEQSIYSKFELNNAKAINDAIAYDGRNAIAGDCGVGDCAERSVGGNRL